MSSNDLIWGDVDELRIPFEPSKIYMSEEGRIYHPFLKYPFVGLIASKVGIEISNNFIFQDKSPKYFKWDGKEYELTNECSQLLKTYRKNKVIG